MFDDLLKILSVPVVIIVVLGLLHRHHTRTIQENPEATTVYSIITAEPRPAQQQWLDTQKE